MPKEDRSDWVAVAPEFAESSLSSTPKIRPASSAYQFFQKDVTEEAKRELIAAEGKFEVGKFSRLIRDRWNRLEDDKKEYYEGLAREDAMRFASESHAADVAAMERKAKLRRERETLILDDEGGDKRKTRGQRRKIEKKKILWLSFFCMSELCDFNSLNFTFEIQISISKAKSGHGSIIHSNHVFQTDPQLRITCGLKSKAKEYSASKVLHE